MSRKSSQAVFTAIKSEGGILPPDLLQRVAAGDKRLPGLDDEAYHLDKSYRIGEAISSTWARALGAWKGFQEALGKLPEDDLAIRVTRERWLLPLFKELGYGRLPGGAQDLVVDDHSYAISHSWHHSPIHLMGCRVPLDKRLKGVAGAAAASPHGLVQDFLNRSEGNLWGFVSNGYLLRVLRDNHSITRQAYVEFDLQSIMEGELYAEFMVLWLTCHQSRVEADKPEECWLEKWFTQSRDEGVAALDQMRGGVEKAIAIFGEGFLKYRANTELRSALESGQLSAQDYYRQLLRLVYRLIFLFVAEDREALLDPKANIEARERYGRFYATRRLRDLAMRRRGSPHTDLWQGLALVMKKLGDGSPELALPALGSFLWGEQATPWIDKSLCDNEHLLSALRALCLITEGKVRRPVSWAIVGSEELGSIYEALLELHPRINREAGTFELGAAAGHERKTTGSYYTPSSLVDCLLDSALMPVLDEAAKRPEPEKAILDLKVCDPACGSGHFLVAAARRMAKRLASVRSGETEPGPAELQHALRDVVGRCIYGVDINPMAVELCKVSLWMEAIEPGRPLSFLDARIKQGNSLLGTTPALMEKGILDEAFTPIEGDDRKYCSEYKKRNKQERKGQQDMFAGGAMPWDKLGNLAASMMQLSDIDDSSIAGVRERQKRYEELVGSSGYLFGRMLADGWCAAFVWKKRKSDELPYPITEDVYRKIEKNPHSVPPWMKDEIMRLAKEYGFFHWHLEYPTVFRLPGKDDKPENEQCGWSGGFDCVLGNPPWEHVEVKEQEWFAARSPEISKASNAAARKRMIGAMKETDPVLHGEYVKELRAVDAENQLVRESGRFPLCAKGRINTFALFAELNRSLLGSTGRAGFIVPTGIATDDTTKDMFQAIVRTRTLASLYDFKNSDRLFYDVGHRRFHFCLLTLAGEKAPATKAWLVFFALDAADVRDSARRFTLELEEFAILNPNTFTCATFRSRRDADLNLAIYRRAGVLWREEDPKGNPWGLRFMQGIFNMASDSGLFRTRAELEHSGNKLNGNIFDGPSGLHLPLVEAKMVHHFDHRFGDYADKPPDSEDTQLPDVPDERLAIPNYQPIARYWVRHAEVGERLKDRWLRGWLFGWRDICRSTDQRTIITSLIPRVAVGHKLPLMMPTTEPVFIAALYANLCSFSLDYATRQKVGGTSLTYFVVKQLPVLPPTIYANITAWAPSTMVHDWLLPRVLELTYTAWDLEPFAKDVGYDGPPFRWDPERRFLLRAELDAAFFHLYGIARDDVDYIMETFPIVKRKDEAAHGEYRTKRVILEIYDEMAEAAKTGKAYKTRLDPPPAAARVAHSESTRPEFVSKALFS